MIDWNLYPDFEPWEFVCSHTGKNAMHPEFMELLQRIRTEYDRPININSGYRDKTHPLEAAKDTTGAHTLGLACDIDVRGQNALDLLRICLNRGINRLGVYQQGDKRWIHIDIGDRYGYPIALWSK